MPFLLLLSLVTAFLGWLSVAPWIEAVALTTKFGYLIYGPLITLAIWFFLSFGSYIRHRTRGYQSIVFSIFWLLVGWIPTYFFAIALTSGLAFVASRVAALAFVPVGLPIADMCAISTAIGGLGFAVTLLKW